MADSCLPRSQTNARYTGQLLQPVELALQVSAPHGGEPVGLLFPRSVLRLESLDPVVFKEPAESPIQRSGAQPDPAGAEDFDVLQQGIAVAGSLRQAQQYQEDGLGQRT